MFESSCYLPLRQGVEDRELLQRDNIRSNIFCQAVEFSHHFRFEIHSNECLWYAFICHLQAQAAQQFESQTKKEEMSEAEKEELAVRKRREEGTPVTDETFEEWRNRFNEEMRKIKEEERIATSDDSKDKKAAAAAATTEERLTGFQIFSEKAGVFNLEKLEAAAEEMANDTSALDPDELADVDEELFDDDDDLDDFEFDSDEDDNDDDDDDDDFEDGDDEPDI